MCAFTTYEYRLNLNDAQKKSITELLDKEDNNFNQLALLPKSVPSVAIGLDESPWTSAPLAVPDAGTFLIVTSTPPATW